jgi:hypothetical protein
MQTSKEAPSELRRQFNLEKVEGKKREEKRKKEKGKKKECWKKN